ncbi:TetR/AcrR family transcriptional regulator [Cerasicoccus frondis]|uniref:TetR/AcrR family transcriptional regulator n=1 Tax=Cerasicoccus frondis TaxID=490090 RepID=UPI002852B056|nr:CerR family C-terminal domain-containing protein [Cerasicoccus frondis]
MITKTKKAEDTCERLLNAGAEHFALHGFRQTRVQDICQIADANQAAVSYHFGGKYELYVSCLRHALKIASSKYPLPSDSTLPAEKRLEQLMTALCRRIFDDGDGSLFPKLIVKEMAEPTEALETILADLIAHERDTLIGIVRDSLGPQATDEDVMLTHLSVVALFQFYNFSRSIRQLMERKKRKLPPNVDLTINHTVSFALAGIRSKRAEIEARA